MASAGTPMLVMARALKDEVKNPREAWAKMRDSDKARMVGRRPGSARLGLTPRG